jgi:hypothetical protein
MDRTLLILITFIGLSISPSFGQDVSIVGPFKATTGLISAEVAKQRLKLIGLSEIKELSISDKIFKVKAIANGIETNLVLDRVSGSILNSDLQQPIGQLINVSPLILENAQVREIRQGLMINPELMRGAIQPLQ